MLVLREPAGALRGGDLGFDDGFGEARDLLLQVGAHALLLAQDLAREFLRVAVADRLRERLDAAVGGDLLGLAGVLGLGVLQVLLLGAGAADRVQRALRERDRFLRAAEHGLRRAGDRVGAGRIDRRGFAAELFDAFAAPRARGVWSLRGGL